VLAARLLFMLVLAYEFAGTSKHEDAPAL